MSLLSSVNSGSASQPYAIANVGSAAVPVIGAPAGITRLQDDGVGNTAIRSAKSNGVLILGANDSTTSNITCTSTATVIQTDLTMPTGSSTLRLLNGADLLVTGSATFQGSVDMSTTAPTLKTLTKVGASIPNAAATALPQPAGLSAGLYHIGLSCPGNEDVQASAIGYWNGTAWTIGATGTATRIGGVGIVCVIEPVTAGGASLQIYQNTGGALNVPFIYYTQLAAQF
jgi:hypothetical protein